MFQDVGSMNTLWNDGFPIMPGRRMWGVDHIIISTVWCDSLGVWKLQCEISPSRRREASVESNDFSLIYILGAGEGLTLSVLLWSTWKNMWLFGCEVGSG